MSNETPPLNDMEVLSGIFRTGTYSGPLLRFSRVTVGLDGPEALLLGDLIRGQVANLEFERSNFSLNLSHSTFRDVSFLRCDFDRVSMRHTQWQHCSFAGTTMVPDMNDAVFEDCSFAGAKLRGLNSGYGGRRTRFVRCDFRGCIFDRVQFLAGRLVDCDVTGLHIIGSDMRGTSHNGVPLEIV